MLALIESKNYRSFIEQRFLQLKSENKSLTYTRFSKSAGFASRSFPKDVIQGYRRITAKSLPGFVRAMKLSGDLKTFFNCLVMLDEEDLNPSALTEAQIKENLEKLKNRIRLKLASAKQPISQSAYRIKHCADVFAALGTAETGASLAEIVKRTRLLERDVLKTLSEMIEITACRYDAVLDRYFSESPHLIYQEIGKDQFFKDTFLESLKDVKTSATLDFARDDRLFFSSSFSVDQKKLLKFKQELRDLMIRFIDHAENPNGDTVAKCMVSLIEKPSSIDDGPRSGEINPSRVSFCTGAT